MKNYLDYDILDELCEIMGDDMQMLVESYVSDSADKLKSLKELNIKTQQDDIYRLAHSLKGSSRNLGLAAFAEYCENIEKTARNEKLDENTIDWPNFENLYTVSIEELKEKY